MWSAQARSGDRGGLSCGRLRPARLRRHAAASRNRIRTSATSCAVLDAVAARERAILVGCSQGGRDRARRRARRTPLACARWCWSRRRSAAHPRSMMCHPPSRHGSSAWKRAEASADVDRINALEAHAWLDGPLAPEGRVSGAARELFLDMNELALRAEQRGTEISPPSAYERVRRDRRTRARDVGRPRFSARRAALRLPREVDAEGERASLARRRASAQSRRPGGLQPHVAGRLSRSA